MNFTERTELVIGTEGLKKLQSATVLVVGCGAVGGFCLESLARAGIGHLIIVDFDTFSISNLNRQIFATTDTVGKLKTKVAHDRLKSINPNIKIDIINEAITESNMHLLFTQKIDYAVDAIDSLHAKTCLIEALIKNNIPFISAMGAARKTDLTKIKVAPLKKTIQCPLASFVRKRLRHRNIPLDFPVVYSSECIANTQTLGEKTPEPLCQRGRHTLGSLVTITGIFGLTCAHEAIMWLVRD